jgi:hypothetical protein
MRLVDVLYTRFAHCTKYSSRSLLCCCSYDYALKVVATDLYDALQDAGGLFVSWTISRWVAIVRHWVTTRPTNHDGTRDNGAASVPQVTCDELCMQLLPMGLLSTWCSYQLVWREIATSKPSLLLPLQV